MLPVPSLFCCRVFGRGAINFLVILLGLFVLGAQVGSFLNVCIWRLPRGESIVQPPSHCPRCDTRLGALDLVPLLSQAFLRARCRYCGAKISWRYFGIEFLTGALFVLVGMQPGNLQGDWWTGMWAGDKVRLLRDLVVVSALVVVFFIDYETFLIPLSAALLIGLAGVGADAWSVAQGSKSLTDGAVLPGVTLLPAPLPESVAAMVVTAMLLWLLRAVFSWLYRREAMGFGDVFLVAGIAANIGWSVLLWTFFFLSVTLGAFIGVSLQIPRAIRAFRWAKARAARQNRDGAATLEQVDNVGVEDVSTQDVAMQSAQAQDVTAQDVTAENLAASGRATQHRPSLAWPLARHAFRRAIPFGPMLAVGAIVTLLYGARLNETYLNWVNGQAVTAPSLNSSTGRNAVPMR